MDFFAVKLSKAINPPGSAVCKEESELTFATEEERKRYRMRRKTFLAIQAHRMRRDGIVVIGLGLVALAVLFCVPSFESFPSSNVLVNVGDFITRKIQTPWGPYSVIAAIGLTLIAWFLFAAGIEHWKLRQNYFKAWLCFVLGLIILLEGIFQWQ